MDMSSRTITDLAVANGLVGVAYAEQASFLNKAALHQTLDDKIILDAFMEFGTAINSLDASIGPALDRPMYWVPVKHDGEHSQSIHEFERTCEDVENIYTVQTDFGSIVSIFMTLYETRAVYFRMEFG